MRLAKKAGVFCSLLALLYAHATGCGGVGSFTIGGTVTGLNGTLVMQCNATDDLTVIQDGSFTFTTALADGTDYAVTVLTHPEGQTCTVNTGSGTLSGSNITDVAVTCSENTYTVGGTVTGLIGTVVLQNNSADDLSLTSDGTFNFATPVADGADYSVTVLTQPIGQTCTVNNGSGTISGADITDVTVTCSVNSYTVGGTVSGLSGTLVLQNNSGDDLTLTTNGSFTFATSLAHNSSYAVTVSSRPIVQNCAVSSGSGTVSGANVTDVAITCSNKVWTHPADLTDYISTEGYDADASSLRVAMKGDVGNAVVVWTQYVPTYHIFMSEFRNGSWTHPIDQDDHRSIINGDYVHAAMDESGNAIIVWSGSDGSNDQIFMSEYRNGAWTHPVDQFDNISPNGQDAYNPWVAMDDNGNAIIVWEQKEDTGNFYQIFKSEYRNGSWTHPSDLTSANYISPDGADAYEAKVAMDNNGNAIIIWRQDNDSGTSYNMVFMSEYRGGSWTHPASRSSGNYISPDGSNVSQQRVAMSDNGDAVITWVQPAQGTSGQIFRSEYRNGSWTHPGGLMINISPDLPGGPEDAGWPRVAMDDSGNTIIVWEQYEDDGIYTQIFKSEYRGGSWTDPANLDTDYISPAGYEAEYPDVAMDNNGQAIIVWSQKNTSSDFMIFKSEYRGGSWTNPTDVDNDAISASGQNAYEPQVAMDPNGDAIIVWGQSDVNNDQIFMSEFR